MAASGRWPERTWRALEQAGAEHLRYEQLEAYVDARADADDVELVRAHTALCAPCAAELRELADFSRVLRAQASPQAADGWARLRSMRWLSVPRLAWAAAAAAALVVVLVMPRQSPRNALQNSTAAPRGVTEAVLPSGSALVETPAVQTGRPFRVLSQDQAAAYQRERAAAPDDSRARAAIAIKYALFGIAEQEYRTLEASGGQDAEDARRLLQELERLRHR